MEIEDTNGSEVSSYRHFRIEYRGIIVLVIFGTYEYCYEQLLKVIYYECREVRK